jgi:hypothetical protein
MNVCHFGTVEAKVLRYGGEVTLNAMTAEFHKNLPVGSKVVTGVHTDSMAISCPSLSFWGEKVGYKMPSLKQNSIFTNVSCLKYMCIPRDLTDFTILTLLDTSGKFRRS